MSEIVIDPSVAFPAEDEVAPTPKEQQILAGARACFLELGFEGASVDEIARRAGVSKPTLYKYFADKPALYARFMTAECDRFSQSLFRVDLEQMNLEEALLSCARGYVALLTSPVALGIFRVSIGEAKRFPDLARTFYDSGPARGMRRLSHLIAAAVSRRELQVPDVDLAAAQFMELCKGEVFYRLLFGLVQSVPDETKEATARSAVQVFMRGYAPTV